MQVAVFDHKILVVLLNSEGCPFVSFDLPLLLTTGNMPLSFRTPPVSPPRTNYLPGLRRVCSLEFRPHLTGSPDSGLADSFLGASGSERSLLPLSTIYNWSCGHFSKPLLSEADDSQEIDTKREEKEKFALEHIAKCQHSCKYFFLFYL